MKIHLDKAGASPVAADFDLLRAGLIAAQAASPTARASAAAHRLPRAADALVEFFVGRADADAMAALHASFSPAVARIDPEEER